MDWISLRACPVFGLAIVLCCPASSWGEPPEKEEIRLARLIRDLGASDYARRQQAEEALAGAATQSDPALQRALSDNDLEVRLRAQRILDRLRLDEVWAGGRVTYQASSQASSKVLAALAEQTGNHIHIGDPYGNFAEQSLEVDYRSLGYWEAIDDICRRTGNRIRPHYDAHTPGIVISAGSEGKYPRAYGGPVRAQITGARRVFIEEVSYEDRKSELTHLFQINLQLVWEDRFHLVGYANQPELVEAVTDGGAVITSAQSAALGWNAANRGLRQLTATMKLNPVPLSAKSFSTFKIKWGLIAVSEPAELQIDRLAAQRVESRDDLTAKVESIEKLPAGKYLVTISICRDLAMPEPQDVVYQEYDVELFDGEGRAFRLLDQSPALTDRGVQLKLSFMGESAQSEPESLRLHYPRLRTRRDVELVFRDVPLPVGKPD